MTPPERLNPTFSADVESRLSTRRSNFEGINSRHTRVRPEPLVWIPDPEDMMDANECVKMLSGMVVQAIASMGRVRRCCDAEGSAEGLYLAR